jgi:hypothetical protein
MFFMGEEQQRVMKKENYVANLHFVGGQTRHCLFTELSFYYVLYKLKEGERNHTMDSLNDAAM